MLKEFSRFAVQFFFFLSFYGILNGTGLRNPHISNFDVRSSIKWRKKIVKQVLKDRCKEVRSI